MTKYKHENIFCNTTKKDAEIDGKLVHMEIDCKVREGFTDGQRYK